MADEDSTAALFIMMYVTSVTLALRFLVNLMQLVGFTDPPISS